MTTTKDCCTNEEMVPLRAFVRRSDLRVKKPYRAILADGTISYHATELGAVEAVRKSVSRAQASKS